MLAALIDGKAEPLTECFWILYHACGCPIASQVAAFPDEVMAATEDDAWRKFADTPSRSKPSPRDGYSIELLTRERFNREIVARPGTLGCTCQRSGS